ncbi:hypothetical protein V2I01_25520 [Micromonospora sp. BRA006-A]|nr:hypothetical protein [Micromonospora sp. BRA006-A]
MIMKLGRTFTSPLGARAGRARRGLLVRRTGVDDRRAGTACRRRGPRHGAVLLDRAGPRRHPARVARYDLPATRVTEPYPGAEVVVVGLGPGPDRWLSPRRRRCSPRSATSSATARTSSASRSAGLVRHASGNTVELERARQALELALAGERVAVVSGGDAGVFGMASAVFEAAEDPATPASPSVSYPGSPPSRRSRRARARRSGPISR